MQSIIIRAESAITVSGKKDFKTIYIYTHIHTHIYIYIYIYIHIYIFKTKENICN